MPNAPHSTWKTYHFVFVVLLFTVPSTSMGDPSDGEQVGREMVDAAAQAALNELGYDMSARLIDLGFQNTPPVGDELSVGQETIAWIRLGLAVNNLFNADTDKGKFYAGVDTVVSGLMIANPAVGAIAALAVLATKLADSVVSGNHAETMLEIERRIAEHYTAMAKTYQQLVKTDYQNINNTFEFFKSEYQAVLQLQDKLDRNCGPSSLIHANSYELQSCFATAIAMFPHVQNVLTSIDDLLHFESQFFSLDRFLVKGKGLDGKEFRKSISSRKKEFHSTMVKAQRISEGFSNEIAATAIRAAKARGKLRPLAILRNSCYQSVSRLNSHVNLVLIRWGIELPSSPRQDLASIHIKYKLMLSQGCKKISFPGEEDPLYRQLIIWEETKLIVQQALYREDNGN